jgi:formate/nitrite transporter FocA (FNT family)
MCGVLMYIAVDVFKNRKSEDIGKYIGVFICVSVFILCKFEHCVADMIYFGMMNELSLFSFKALKYIVIVTIGNGLGANLIPLTIKLIRSLNN